MRLLLASVAIFQICLSAWSQDITGDTNVPSPREIEITRLAAAGGSAEAQYLLGNYYYRGRGVATNQTLAVDWFQKAADQGNIWAQCCLGACYLGGKGVTADKAKAVAWFRKAADQGYPNAQYSLGLCYTHGDGVPADPKEALKWYFLAGQYGDDADAQFAVARCLYDGAGIKTNRSEAVNWYEKAAAQDIVAAQMLAGLSYWFGWDVNPDQPKGVEWFKRAAEQGEPQAFVFLSAAYLNVKGLRTNYIQAYKWGLLAREYVDPGMTSELAKMQRPMLPWHVWKARRLAQEFKERRTIKPLLGYSVNTRNMYVLANLARAYRDQFKDRTADELVAANPYFMSGTNLAAFQPY